jgi:AcrR family transcriptional regulator
MASFATRKRLLDAAEQLFAEKGYAGASVRCITSMADVDLGAVRYHFGSKDGLFSEVMKRRLVPLCDERFRLLDDLEARHRTPPVEAISEAFLMPAIRMVIDPGHGEAWKRLIGRVRVEPGDYLDGVQAIYCRLLKRYLGAFERALPDLPKDELTYRFFFLFGAEVNTLIDDGTLRVLGAGLPDLDEEPDAICERLIRFVSAGMRAALPAALPAARPDPFGAPSPTRGAARADGKSRTRVG